MIEILRQHEPFNHLEQATLELLNQNGKIKSFKSGKLITSPNDGIASSYFIILSGSVSATDASKNLNHSLWELNQGESFPIGALLANREVKNYYIANTKTEILITDINTFKRLLESSTHFKDFCTRRLANLLDRALSGIQGNNLASNAEYGSLNTPLRALLTNKTVSCSADTSIRQALELIEKNQRRSIAILDDAQKPTGILTLRDVMSRVTLPGVDISTPIRQVMSPVKATLTPDQLAFEAVQLMAETGHGHVCVTQNNKFAGLISERDLFSLQRVGLGNLSKAILNCNKLNKLELFSSQIAQLTSQMMAQGASASQLLRLIATLNDSLTRRVIELCEQEYGKPDHEYTWISFGSEGRLEQTLKTDQDNGIIFVVPENTSTEEVRNELIVFAKQVNQHLDSVGFPLCPGNIMASNPECCLSLEEWQKQFNKWIETGTPEHLLKASIFFDFRALYGSEQPCIELFDWLAEKAKRFSRFRHMLAANIMRIKPPLGLIRDFVTQTGGEHPDTFDIKLQGVTPFVDAARVIALEHGINKTSTEDRLQTACDMGHLKAGSTAAWLDAYRFIQTLRMQLHQQQLRAGEPLTNYLNPDSLNDLQKRILKEAFRQARKLQALVALHYQL